jgi:pyroglutamyl-peptidase
MSLLFTAFVPFDGGKTNSSQIILSELKRLNWGDKFYFLLDVPVSFTKAWPYILNKIESLPHIQTVIAFGQAEPRTKITCEHVALNYIDARIPDNDGHSPQKGPINANGPDIYWSTINWNNIDLPNDMIEPSYHAGTYVCNFVMYKLLEWSKANSKNASFIHIPLLDTQTDFSFEKYPIRLETNHAVRALDTVLKNLSL